MAHLHIVQRTLSLQASLEAVAQLGEDHLLIGAGEEWKAPDLLEWLQRDHPTVLTVPVALVLSDATGEGAILDVDRTGKVINRPPIYRIERRPPTVYLI